jgi:hypothetical protein
MALPISELLNAPGKLLAKIERLPAGTIYTVGDENPIDVEFVKHNDKFTAGGGGTKIAYYVRVHSGKAIGKTAVLLTPVINKETNKTYTKTIFETQLKAHELGYAPEPYTYSLDNEGILVSELVKGIRLCDIPKVSIEQQFSIMKATLDLHTHNLYQLDPACNNYYIDTDNKVYIIDNIFKTKKQKTLVFVLDILKDITNLSKVNGIKHIHEPIIKFALYMRDTNEPLLISNKRTAPLQGLTPEQIADVGEDFYSRAMELFKPYDIAELASTVAEPNTYFKLNGGVYKHIRTVDTGLFCKRLGEDRLWSTEESRIEMNSLINIQADGIFRCNTQAGGGKRTTRRAQKLRPTCRKNVRKSVRRKHT